MDTSVVIGVLGSVIGTLAGYIALQQRVQLQDKDKLIASQNEQLERQQVTLETLAASLKESLVVLHDLQDLTETIRQELEIRRRVAKRQPPSR